MREPRPTLKDRHMKIFQCYVTEDEYATIMRAARLSPEAYGSAFGRKVLLKEAKSVIASTTKQELYWHYN